jgi:NAD(P)H dehydrogenase (quinone)
MSGPKIGIIIYTLYGHVSTMAEAVKKGVESAGGSATIYQVPETLPQEVLTKMSAPPKPNYPVATANDLPQYDGYLIGISTRYGSWPAQLKTFWDSTGQLWQTGALSGKFVGAFLSTAGPGGGQESTFLSIMSTFVHHGMVFVPLGYAHAFAQLTNLSEVHGGSPWGAGTFAGADGSRQPTPHELEVAEIQGKVFYTTLKRGFP